MNTRRNDENSIYFIDLVAIQTEMLKIAYKRIKVIETAREQNRSSALHKCMHIATREWFVIQQYLTLQ